MNKYDCCVKYEGEWIYICTVEAKNSNNALEAARNLHGYLNFEWRVTKL